jgi:membrane-associated HD superfamily phosphohydrolase
MADAVEAASRALPDAGPAALRDVVGRLVQGIFADGQLDDCDLTLRDLSAIAKSFCRTLEGIYHSRPDYPAAAKGPEAGLVAAASGAAAPAGERAADDADEEPKQLLN